MQIGALICIEKGMQSVLDAHVFADLEDELEDAPRPAARQADAQDFGEFLEDEDEDEFGDFIEDDLGGGAGGAQGAAGEQPSRRRRRMTGMPAGVSAAAMRVHLTCPETSQARSHPW